MLSTKCLERVLKYSYYYLVSIIKIFLFIFVSFTTILCQSGILLALAQILIALTQSLIALAQSLIALAHLSSTEKMH